MKIRRTGREISWKILDWCGSFGGSLYRPIGTTEEEDPVSRVIDFVLGRGLHSHYVYP